MRVTMKTAARSSSSGSGSWRSRYSRRSRKRARSSWDPVTSYTDGTPIEAGKTVTYSAYWTTDSGLGSLRTFGSSLATTSTTFDPDIQGMPRGGTVYFTVKAVLNTGEESALSPAYAWVVPRPRLASAPVTAPPGVLTGIAVSGPSSVNEGGTGTYTATGTWDNGTTAAISPTWSESSIVRDDRRGGVLTAAAVTSNQPVTVTASYGGRTGAMSVTIVDAGGGADRHRGERPVVGERRRDGDVHGDGDVGQRDDGGDHPDVERELARTPRSAPAGC